MYGKQDILAQWGLKFSHVIILFPTVRNIIDNKNVALNVCACIPNKTNVWKANLLTFKDTYI